MHVISFDESTPYQNNKDANNQEESKADIVNMYLDEEVQRQNRVSIYSKPFENSKFQKPKRISILSENRMARYRKQPFSNLVSTDTQRPPAMIS